MATADQHPTPLSEAQRQELKTLVAWFEHYWDERRLSGCAAQLPAGSPVRRPALLEMIKIDLKRQWQRGRRPTVEAYLHFYPDLGPAAEVPVDLILAEVEARRLAGLPEDPAAYARRFPRQAAELHARLEQLRWETLGSAQDGHTERGASPGPAAPARDPGDTLPGQFGRYRILQKLGQGGMGAVYLAHDSQLDRRVALKVPRFAPEDGSQTLERFYREARSAATLDHPNICPVYDVGSIEGVHYLTMAYIEGQPLSRLVGPGRPLPQAQAAALVRQLALALHEAHQKGVIHRDLKPSNIMLRPSLVPVIMDFGLARRVNQEESRLTQTGMVLGTPAFMSPEQVNGDVAAIGPPSDVYSLGVILYELLTGRLPFEGPITAVLGQILTREPPPPTTHRPDLDPRLQEICRRAMAKRIQDRFRSMAELADALDHYLRGPDETTQASTVPRPADQDNESLTLVNPPPLPPPITILEPRAGRGGSLRWWLIGGGAAALAALVIVLILVLGGKGTGSGSPVDLAQARSEAEVAWDRVKDLDRAQGFGAKLNEAEIRLRKARLLADQQAAEARAEFQAVTAQCRALQELEQQRKQARAARAEAEAAQQQGRQARAPEEAGAFWTKAEELLSAAEREFEAGEFSKARQGWKEAARAFGTAREAVAGLPLVASARTAYEAELRKYEREQLEADGGPAWKKAVEAVRAAEQAAREGRFKEAADRYREAREQVAAAGRQADLPRLKREAVDAGLEMTAWIIGNILADVSDEKERARVMKLAEETRGRMQRKLRALKVPEEVIQKLANEKKFDTEKTTDYQQRVPELVRKAWGKEAGASFTVGIQLAWLLGGLTVEAKKPGNITETTFLNYVERARTAGYEAGYPKEYFDDLDKLAALISAGKLADAQVLVSKLIDKVSGLISGPKFFRQPKAARPK